MKRKTIVSIMLMLAIVISIVAGCGSKDTGEKTSVSESADGKTEKSQGDDSTQQGKITYPLKTDIEKVSWYIQGAPLPHEKFKDASESPFHTGLAENLGVNIEWIFPTTGSDGNTFTATLLADPDNLPDIMGGTSFTSYASQYIDDEFIWDLTDYIQEYAPDYYAFLQSNPAYDKAMKDDKGRYYSFGFFREDGGWNDSYKGPVVRKDWLEECNLEVPTTISEFENVIKTFHEKYGAVFDSANSRIGDTGFSGAFGAYGHSSAGWGWYVKDGKVKFGMAQDEWRNYLKWLNGLWKSGLIDQDQITEDDNTIKDKIHNDKCGISYTSMGQMNNWNKERVAAGKEDAWIGIPNPTGDDGTLSCVYGGLGIGTVTTVISKSADEETMKLCLKMLNYAYTEEGFLYWNYGKEGVSWENGENNVPKFTNLVTDDMDTDPMTKYNGATWSGPCIQATNLLYLKNSPEAIKANDAWFYIYDDKEKNEAVTGGWRLPTGMTYSTEEADEMDEIGQNIKTFVAENFTAFYNGSKDINDDAVWNKYLDDLETYNLSRILEIRQAAYDRYLNR